MRLFSVRNASLAVLAMLALAGCDNGPTTGNISVTPTPEVSETFTGTLTKNGALTHSFIALGAGTITATATALDPSDAIVGLDLGTWNGVACALVITNGSVAQGAVVTGQANAAGNFCVRISDATGTLAGDTAYTLTVAHR